MNKRTLKEGKAMTSPIVTACLSCGFIASDLEFSPNGDTTAELTCPRCGNQDSITDFEPAPGGPVIVDVTEDSVHLIDPMGEIVCWTMQEWVDDKRSGRFVGWYRDGELAQEGTFVDGKLHGECYFCKPIINVKVVCYFNHGKLERRRFLQGGVTNILFDVDN